MSLCCQFKTMLTRCALGNKDYPDKASLFILETFYCIKITTILHAVLISRVLMFRERFSSASQKALYNQINVENTPFFLARVIEVSSLQNFPDSLIC